MYISPNNGREILAYQRENVVKCVRLTLNAWQLAALVCTCTCFYVVFVVCIHVWCVCLWCVCVCGVCVVCVCVCVCVCKCIGETGVSWPMGFVGTLSFSLSANYDFTKEYHLYKGTNNTHTPYRFQSCSTNTCRNKSTLFDFAPSVKVLNKFFSFQTS